MSECVALKRPDETEVALEHVPDTREEAFQIVTRYWVELGRYEFIRRVSDRKLEVETEIAEIAVSAYSKEDLTIALLEPAGTIEIKTSDIALYLRNATGISGCAEARLSLDVYDDKPYLEKDFVWLNLEEPSGNRLAEFGLNPRGRFSLSNTSGTLAGRVFVCELPSIRSVFRFAIIACDIFRCDRVRIRSFSINTESIDRFF